MPQDTGAPWTIPFPEDADPVNIVGDMQSLAVKTHEGLDLIEATVNNIVATPGGPVALPPEITILPSQVVALQAQNTALQQALTSAVASLNSLAAHVAKHDPKVYRSARSTNVNIAAGSTWRTPSGYSWSWAIPMSGVIMINANTEMNDNGSKAGDPRSKLVIGGSAYVSGGAGIAIAGIKAGGASTMTVPVDGIANVRAGTLTVSIQVNTTTSNQVSQIKRAQVSGMFVPVMGSFPTVAASTYAMDIPELTDDGTDGS